MNGRAGDGGFAIAPFRFDVTPPLGHALLGGWIEPAIAIDDALEAIGYLLLGADAPIVVCTLDWAGLLNDSHLAWCIALAAAAGTTPDRVAVHRVHQHNAPLVCSTARAAAAKHPELPEVFDPAFFATCLARAGAAVRAALSRAQAVTHIAHARAVVRNVASNRRVARDVEPRRLRRIEWRTDSILPLPPAKPTAAALEAVLAKGDAPLVDRLISAFRLGWMNRATRGVPLGLSRMRLNTISILHLPGEMFISYQLRAQALRPRQPVAVAAYGDGGPWYVPTKEEFPAGGYEVSVAFCNDDVDALVSGAIQRLLD